MEPLTPPGEVAAQQTAPEDYRGGTGAGVATGIFIALMAGLALLYALALAGGLQALLDPDGEAATALERNAAGISAGDLWVETGITFVFMGVLPVLWLLATRVKPVDGTLAYLQLTNAGPSLARGAGLGILMFIAVIVLSAIELAIQGDLNSLTSNETDSPVTEALIRELSLPLAIWIALGAAVGEEILFRGVLQKKIGWIGQGAVFGLAHAGYATVAQIVIPLAIGLLFGWLIKKGHSLWLVIAAHFSYNFVQLALALVL